MLRAHMRAAFQCHASSNCVFPPLHSGSQPAPRGGRSKRGSEPGGSPDRPAPNARIPAPTCPAPSLVDADAPSCSTTDFTNTIPVPNAVYVAANNDPALLAEIQQQVPVHNPTFPTGQAAAAAPFGLPAAGIPPALAAQFMAWMQAMVSFTELGVHAASSCLIICCNAHAYLEVV